MLVEESKNHKKYKLNLETWSPVHIGSGKKLSRWEYFIDNQKLYYLDYEKLAKIALQEPVFIDNLTKEASQNQGSSNLSVFLKRYPNRIQQIKSISREFNHNTTTVRELNLLVGSPYSYIPGSSIKGVLRTSFISYFISKEKLHLDKDPKVTKNILKSTFDMGSQHNQIFTNFIIHDSLPLNNDNIAIAFIRLFAPNPKSKDKNQGQDLYCEVVKPETLFNIEVIERVSAKLKFQVVLKMADEFYRKIWELEKVNRQKSNDIDVHSYYKNDDFQPPKDKFLLRLGFGSGQLATSILTNYKEKFGTDKPLRVGPAYKRSPHKLDRDPYPYTAKSACINHDYDPMGWVVIDKW